MIFLSIISSVIRPYDEVVGRLHDVMWNDNHILCYFNFFDIVEIPKEAFNVEYLKHFKGSKIGITNMAEEGYRLRKVIRDTGGNKNGNRMEKAKE